MYFEVTVFTVARAIGLHIDTADSRRAVGGSISADQENQDEVALKKS